VKACRHPLFCTHCRRYGHTSNVCFKKNAEGEEGAAAGAAAGEEAETPAARAVLRPTAPKTRGGGRRLSWPQDSLLFLPHHRARLDFFFGRGCDCLPSLSSYQLFGRRT